MNKSRVVITWDIIKLIPIILFVGIMPLTVRMKVVEMPNLVQNWLPTPLIYSDVFNYYKLQLIILSACLGLVFLCVGWVMGKANLQLSIIDKFAIGFLLSVLISTLISPTKEVVWFGYPERWHGFWTWFSYIVMYLYIKLSISSKKDLMNCLYVVLGSGLILTLIGFLQFLSLDPFRTDFVKRLIVPANFIERYGLESLKFTFELNRVYLTLYNPNNVGLYGAAMIPLCVYGFIHSENRIVKVLWSVFACLSVIAIVGSFSRAGLVVLLSSVIIFGLFNIDGIRNYRKMITLSALVIIMVVVIGDFASDRILSNRITEMFQAKPLYTKLRSVDINEKKLEVVYSGESIEFVYSHPNGLCSVYDQNNEILDVEQDEKGLFKFTEEPLEGLVYGYGKYDEKTYYLSIMAQSEKWNFYMGPESFKYMNSYNKLTDLKTAPSVLFDGSERLGSNRGYIWSRSLPLISSRPIFGSGPDSYALRFPQTDYIMIGNVMGDTSKIVDKPHSQYLGMVIEFGMVGISLFLVWCLASFWKGRKSILSMMLTCSLLAFLFYDISVGTGWIVILSAGLINSGTLQK